MELKFLGTGAADWPELKTGDGFHRYLSSLLVNKTLLIDAGPCIFSFESDCGTDLYSEVKNVLFTHSHRDHFCPDSILRLADRSGAVTVYGDPVFADLLPKDVRITFVPVYPFREIVMGDITVLPLPANHGTSYPAEQALHYTLSSSGKTVFYGCDGAWLFNKVSHVLRKMSFDAMIFDMTCGDGEGDFRIFEHNTIKMVEYMLVTIRRSFPEMLNKNCLLIGSHLARTLHTGPEELKQRLYPSGLNAAYDGMEIFL